MAMPIFLLKKKSWQKFDVEVKKVACLCVARLWNMPWGRSAAIAIHYVISIPTTARGVRLPARGTSC